MSCKTGESHEVDLHLHRDRGAILLALLVFAYSGLYDVAATTPHSGPVSWFMHTTYHASMARRAQAVSAPRLDDDRRRLAGAGDYDAMCAGCHGAPGREPDALGKGLNPSPPDLAESASHLTDAELFWVTKYGIRMTGMPAWGKTHSDDDLWSVVAFVRELPGLESAQYRNWVERSAGLSHHGAAEDHPSEEEDHGHADGHAHDHTH